ncbi:MAG: TerC/Alx family metal homeostasis membrane protein [Acidobacteriota bacterium]|nr:TerC/Alx family metal homeostasis membrane protein [Acidobacteriota bacterium]
MSGLWGWFIFAGIVVIMLLLDLGVFQRRAHVISFREATIWSIVWIAVALVFNAGIWLEMGPVRGMEFLTGYLIEKSLSVDNLFVFLVIFAYFHIPLMYQPRVLKWGIVGAIVMRAAMLLGGLELIRRFHWVTYVFGAILVFTGFRLLFEKREQIEPEKNPVLRLFRRVFPVTPQLHGEHFFVKVQGRWHATPLLVALIAVETTDLVFALDSIPAILAITQDPFIVYTSNIFAILGLRALFFMLSGILGLFAYLRYGVAVILAFVGVKLLIAGYVKIPIGVSLSVVFGVLTLSILASVFLRVPPAFEVIRPLFQNARACAGFCRRLMADPRVPRRSRWFLRLALLYALSPIDLIPDFIPIAGHLDDVIILSLLFFFALQAIPDGVVREVWQATQPGARQVGR